MTLNIKIYLYVQGDKWYDLAIIGSITLDPQKKEASFVSDEKKVPAVEQRPPSVTEKQVIAAGQQALERVKRPTFNFKPEEAIFHDPTAETLRANQYRSGGWLHSPAYLELFANTDRRLTKIANDLGDPCEFVERVQALRIKGTKLVYIWPTDKEDPDGIEVKRRKTGYINLITLLGPANLSVETGYRQRYEITFSQPEDHVYPALKIDLGRVLERRKDSDSKSSPPSEEPEDLGEDPGEDETITTEQV